MGCPMNRSAKIYGTLTGRLCLAVVLMLFTSGRGNVFAETAVVSSGRFFHSGDGRLQLVSRKHDASFSGRYRLAGGVYHPKAYAAICRVFGAPSNAGTRVLSLRLIEFIDYIQDHFNPDAEITITSGFRSPQYNTSIRKKGGLAAKASLHQYGMAADLVLAGIDSGAVWNFVKKLGFGGAGFYHGRTVHVDVGPARWWDETNSGVGSGISNENRLIGLVCDFDFYRPGDLVTLRFIRMTAFPVGVNHAFELVPRGGQGAGPVTARFTPFFPTTVKGQCMEFRNIDEMSGIRWQLAADIGPGQYGIRVRFCGNSWHGMPQVVETPVFCITASESG